MPTYQYKREDGTMFEIMQKMSDEALKTCPETGQNVKRVITGGSGVVYKGSGWYVTDYKNRSGHGASGSNGSNGSTNGADPSSAGKAEPMSGSETAKRSTGSKTNGNGEASGAAASTGNTASTESGS